MLVDQTEPSPVELLQELLANEIMRVVRRDDVVEVRVAILGEQRQIVVGERDLNGSSLDESPRRVSYDRKVEMRRRFRDVAQHVLARVGEQHVQRQRLIEHVEERLDTRTDITLQTSETSGGEVRAGRCSVP